MPGRRRGEFLVWAGHGDRGGRWAAAVCWPLLGLAGLSWAAWGDGYGLGSACAARVARLAAHLQLVAALSSARPASALRGVHLQGSPARPLPCSPFLPNAAVHYHPPIPSLPPSFRLPSLADGAPSTPQRHVSINPPILSISLQPPFRPLPPCRRPAPSLSPRGRRRPYQTIPRITPPPRTGMASSTMRTPYRRCLAHFPHVPSARSLPHITATATATAASTSTGSAPR